MKIYFMAWETDNKRGHSIHRFEDGTDAIKAMRYMVKEVRKEFGGTIMGEITASQFNRVD